MTDGWTCATPRHLPHTRGDEPARLNRLAGDTTHLPHTRGDEPHIRLYRKSGRLHLPHTRGDEPEWRRSYGCMDTGICPTRVGMNRRIRPAVQNVRTICPTRVGMNRFLLVVNFTLIHICPTRVGMNRPGNPAARYTARYLPHTRGDEPFNHFTFLHHFKKSAPHAWG